MSKKKENKPKPAAPLAPRTRKVRLLFAQGPWSKGHIFPAMPPNQAGEMVRLGKAEYADLEQLAQESPENRMLGAGGAGGYVKK